MILFVKSTPNIGSIASLLSIIADLTVDSISVDGLLLLIAWRIDNENKTVRPFNRVQIPIINCISDVAVFKPGDVAMFIIIKCKVIIIFE